MDVMRKRLFVSSGLKEARLAEEAITQLGNAFEGDLLFANASQNLGAGDKWKQWIRDELGKCDAGLFLITPAYAASPWMAAEFTALWLSDKPIFILLVGDVTADQLFRPMQDDYQAVSIADVDAVKKMIANLSALCGRTRIPYEFAELISYRCLDAYAACHPKPTNEPGLIDPETFRPKPSDYAKHHLLFESVWDLSPNPDGETMRGECTRTEHFVCQSGIMQYVPVRVAQAANIVRFDPDGEYPVEIVSYDYPGGKVTIDPIGVSPGKDFSFHVRFSPALMPGTEVNVTYRFTIPELKVATTDRLRELLQLNPRAELRNYESFVIQVLDPTDQFNYGINFAPGCLVEPELPEVTWRRSPYVAESARLLGGAYTCTRTDDGGWQLRLERTNPVVDTRYTFKWRLPRREDLR